MTLNNNSKTQTKFPTSIERSSDREMTVTQRFKAPARLVFKAWADPEIFQKWWIPDSFGMKIVSHEADVRTGGSYRIEIAHPSLEQPMAFFGNYLDVTPPSRLVWTNDEGEGEGHVTTVTFVEQGEETLVTVSELYPTKKSLDDAIESGSTGGWEPQFEQLSVLLNELVSS